MRNRQVVQQAVTWVVVVAWLAVGGVWIYWRTSRKALDFAVTFELYPRYHVWFLCVTGALLAGGIVLASIKGTFGAAGWKRVAGTVLVGVACLVYAGFEILDMLHNCGLTYQGFFVP